MQPLIYTSPVALWFMRMYAAGVGEFYVNGLQVCNLQPVAGAPAATCASAGGTCTALSSTNVMVRNPSWDSPNIPRQ